MLNGASFLSHPPMTLCGVCFPYKTSHQVLLISQNHPNGLPLVVLLFLVAETKHLTRSNLRKEKGKDGGRERGTQLTHSLRHIAHLRVEDRMAVAHGGGLNSCTEDHLTSWSSGKQTGNRESGWPPVAHFHSTMLH